jgi:hypothetical protein
MKVYPWQARQSYPLQGVAQFCPTKRPDILPNDRQARVAYTTSLAMDAVIYGLPSVLQYREMFQQAIHPAHARYVGFNCFLHDRDLAGPGYQAFKSPNSDTLYSNAWLDLSNGPALIDVPDITLKYYTLNFLDMFANASNISTRTFGNTARRYLIAPSNWEGTLPSDSTLFRVATPFVWILMRVFAQYPEEVRLARLVQDTVRINPLGAPASMAGAPPIQAIEPASFFAALDFILRMNGHPDQEDAMVYRFRSLGIGGEAGFDYQSLEPEIREGLDAGFRQALSIVSSSRSQLGIPTGTGWTKVDKARYGFNFLSRAVTNHVGLGANVEEENYSFNTFVDSDATPLNGSEATYTLTIKPPPVHAFWSLTLYDAATFELFPNPLDRYLINDRTASLKDSPGEPLTVSIQHQRPADDTFWLPAPQGPFYLVFRAYLPAPEMISSGWRPDPVIRSVLYDPDGGTKQP